MPPRAPNPTIESRLSAYPDAAEAVLGLRTAASEHLASALVNACRALGFALAGVCEARPTARAAELDAWLAQGRQGTMRWLGDDLAVRKDPSGFLPAARSMLVVADQYADGTPDPAPEPGAVPAGRVARYARGRDYHRRIKDRLHLLADVLRARFADEAFRAFADIEPVLEREHAARAGLGWIGKHTLLIHPAAGSYVLLGGLVTTMDWMRPGVAAPEPVPDHCGTCTRCIDACPTRAIEPYRVDASRCIAYLTIERREPIEPDRHGDLAGWLFGCDVCQEVCPHNAAPARRLGRAVHHDYRAGPASIPLLDVLGWSEAQRAAALSGTALKRARLDMLQRNAAVLAGAVLARGDGAEATVLAALREALTRLADDPVGAPLARDAAREALDRAGGTGS